MATKEQEKLLMLREKMQEITLPDHLVQMWSDSLKRILHESNTAKVPIICSSDLCNDIVNCYSMSVIFVSTQDKLCSSSSSFICYVKNIQW